MPEAEQSWGGRKWLQGSIWGTGKGSGPSEAACLLLSSALPRRFPSIPTPSSAYWLISEGHWQQALSRSEDPCRGSPALSILPLGSLLSPTPTPISGPLSPIWELQAPPLDSFQSNRREGQQIIPVNPHIQECSIQLPAGLGPGGHVQGSCRAPAW